MCRWSHRSGQPRDVTLRRDARPHLPPPPGQASDRAREEKISLQEALATTGIIIVSEDGFAAKYFIDVAAFVVEHLGGKLVQKQASLTLAAVSVHCRQFLDERCIRR